MYGNGVTVKGIGYGEGDARAQKPDADGHRISFERIGADVGFVLVQSALLVNAFPSKRAPEPGGMLSKKRGRIGMTNGGYERLRGGAASCHVTNVDGRSILFLTFSVLVANPKKNYFTRWPIPLVVC